MFRRIAVIGLAAAAADHLAEIGLGDLELVHVRRALLDQLDANLVGPVDQVDREVADQLGQIGRALGTIGPALPVIVLAILAIVLAAVRA